MARPPDLPMEQWPDDRLLREAHGGNPEAFTVFCVRSLPGLIRYLRSQCAQRGIPQDLARDFAQDTLMRALRQLREFEASAARPLPKVSVAYLFQIGVNVCRDWVKKNRRVKAFEHIEDLPQEHRISPAEQDRYEEALEFLNYLDSRDRELVELVLMEQMSVAEAGERLDMEKWAAYKAYERAIERIRDLIREHGKYGTGRVEPDHSVPADEA
jgi:RNA polymerase sigma factor (sigma-70 family)